MDWYHANGKNQTRTAHHFNEKYPNVQIKQPLISSWLKAEGKWQDDWACSEAQTAKRIRQTQHPDVTVMMDQWVSEVMADGVLLTGEVLRQKWTRFADLAGIPKDDWLKLSNGWLDRYKTRKDLREYKRHGKAASVTQEMADKEQQRLQELLGTYSVELRDLFNADETGLFYA